MRYALLYDGDCVFCQRQSRTLERLAAPGSVERLDFHAPGVLERFPGVTYERCMRELVLVAPDGRAFGGMEGVARALATRPILGAAARLYYLPGLRQLLDTAYRVIARYRYLLMGRRVAAGECEGGSCALHVPPAPAAPAPGASRTKDVGRR